MNPSLKIAIGLGTVGGAVGGGIVLHQQLSAPTENVLKKLKNDGYSELTDEDGRWTTILTNYIETVKIDANSYLKFVDFDVAEGQTEKLKEKCKDALNSTDIDANYKKAAKWCTSPRSLKKMLKKGLKLLNSSVSDDQVDQSNWDTKISQYNNENNTNKKFKGLPASGAGTVASGAEGRKLIKQECKKLEAKQHYEKDFEANLEKAELWCAIEKNDNSI